MRLEAYLKTGVLRTCLLNFKELSPFIIVIIKSFITVILIRSYRTCNFKEKLKFKMLCIPITTSRSTFPTNWSGLVTVYCLGFFFFCFTIMWFIIYHCRRDTLSMNNMYHSWSATLLPCKEVNGTEHIHVSATSYSLSKTFI